MRHFIIKFFALDYIVPFLGKKINFTRSANVIFPLVVLCASLLLANKTLFFSVMLLVLGLCLFFSFGYFYFFPLKEKDIKHFDEIQYFLWNFYHQKPKKEPEKYNSLWVLLLNPILILLFLAWYFLILKY